MVKQGIHSPGERLEKLSICPFCGGRLRKIGVMEELKAHNVYKCKKCGKLTKGLGKTQRY